MFIVVYSPAVAGISNVRSQERVSSWGLMCTVVQNLTLGDLVPRYFLHAVVVVSHENKQTSDM